MKLEISEVYLLKASLEAATIKAKDAPIVAKTIEKLDKEYQRLEKLQPEMKVADLG